MKGSKKIFTLLIFPLFSIAVGFTGCSEPIGTLLTDSNTGSAPDYIRAEPQQFIYNEKTTFWPEDVKVWRISSSGRKLITDIDKIKFIIGDSGGEVEVPHQTGLSLDSKGIKTVFIRYLDMDTSYHIAVVDPGLGINDGDGTPIIINW